MCGHARAFTFPSLKCEFFCHSVGLSESTVYTPDGERESHAVTHLIDSWLRTTQVFASQYSVSPTVKDGEIDVHHAFAQKSIFSQHEWKASL